MTDTKAAKKRDGKQQAGKYVGFVGAVLFLFRLGLLFLLPLLLVGI